MRCPPQHLAIVAACWTLCVACGALPLFGQTPTEPTVRRLNGVLHRNDTWSGTIIITDDLLIDGATITVAPGTIVEFADARPDHHPTLTVGSPTELGGHVDIQASVDSPVIFRTRRGTNPGRIVVNIRPRAVLSQSPVRVTDSAPASAHEPRSISWQYVQFEDLGYRVDPREAKAGESRYAPAIAFVAKGAAHTLGVAKCSFRNTTRLRLDVADEARVTLLENEFTRCKERLCIEVRGPSDAATPPVQILQQRLSGIIRTQDAAANIAQCLLIGPHAALVIEGDAPRDVEISGNYVHNTTEVADGHYCLNCQNPEAVIRGNILQGGTTCVYSGSRHMSKNVLLAARSLRHPETKGEITQTAYLVRSLPAGAIFEQNLLLGPALSMICPQAPLRREAARSGESASTILRNNVFDGFSRTPRGIHLNPTGASHVQLELYNNVFLRLRLAAFDESGQDETLAYADYNAFAPPPHAPPGRSPASDETQAASSSDAGPQIGEIGHRPHDVRADNADILSLRAVPALPPADFEDDIRSGRASISEVRDRLFNAYSQRPGGSLANCGRHTDPGAAQPPPIGF